MHDYSKQEYNFAADRRKATCIVQKMQLHIWELYLAAADQETRNADEQDTVDAMQQQLYQHGSEYDYDRLPVMKAKALITVTSKTWSTTRTHTTTPAPVSCTFLCKNIQTMDGGVLRFLTTQSSISTTVTRTTLRRCAPKVSNSLAT